MQEVEILRYSNSTGSKEYIVITEETGADPSRWLLPDFRFKQRHAGMIDESFMLPLERILMAGE